MTPDYDIVVIGAGIHGAGVLQAAAAGGYSALLLEQYDRPAQGTSSRSSKLIHGGLRYLEHGELGLVRECLRERRLLLENAPELVALKPFIIPVFEDNRRKAWEIRAGLMLYSLLAGLGRETRFRSLPRREWDALGGMRRTGLRKVFQYSDAQTDDAALTRAVLQSAESLGAHTRFNATFDRAVRTANGYTIHYTDTATGEHRDVTACGVVVAAGPWIDRAMRAVEPIPSLPEIDLVQGTHIILKGDIGDRLFYFDAPDGRAVFTLPWKGDIMVGTTEQIFQGDPAEAHPTPREINYLLAVFNYFFPNFYPHGSATTQEITASFAGLRVLPRNENNPFERTRETLFARDRRRRPQLVGIYGGKLTSYRASAEKALKILKPQLPRRKSVANTRALKLPPA